MRESADVPWSESSYHRGPGDGLRPAAEKSKKTSSGLRETTQASCCPHIPKFYPSILVMIFAIYWISFVVVWENKKPLLVEIKDLKSMKVHRHVEESPAGQRKPLALSSAPILWVLRQISVPIRTSISLFANEDINSQFRSIVSLFLNHIQKS